MSLQVWLPLTKDLRNQGLADVTVTNNGATFNSNGKLGGCYYFDGSNDYISTICTNYPTIFSHDFSMAFWTYSNDDGSRSVYLGNYGLSGGGNWFNLEKYTDDVIRIWWNNGSPDIRSTVSIKESDGWIHICVTRSGNIFKIYKNGVLTQTISNYTISNDIPSTATTFYIGTDYRTSSDIVLKGKINDFRIYDHCLSPMEVKELSKGLVLHYPLDRNGMGPDNLIPNSLTYSGWSINSLWTQSTSNGEIIWSASRTGATSYLWNRIIPPTQFNPNNYPNGITVSFDFKCDDISALDHKCICALQIYKSDGTRIGWYESKNSFIETNYVGSSTLQNGQWKRLSCYFTQGAMQVISTGSYTVADVSYTTVSFQLVKNGSISIKKIKIEEGNHESPYSISSQDDSAIEYDCSGFCNNGSKGGSTISYTSDTPKYAVSTQLIGTTVDTSSNTKTGAAYITGPCSLSNITALTVTWWAKIRKYGRGGIMDLTSWTSNYEEGTDYNTCPLSNWDSTFRLWDGTNAFNFFSYVLKDSTWHHYAVTFTSGSGKFYRDGVNIASSGTMGNTLTNFNGIRTGLGKAGVVYRQIDEDVSDLRIYATALSASDVLSLYQNSAYIDSSGNVYGAVHSEV